MTARERFFLQFAPFLLAHRITKFVAAECCDVGRVHGPSGTVLEAPPPLLWTHIVPTLVYLEYRVRPAFEDAPIDVNSGYRDPVYNRAIGGKPDSLHRFFNALDFNVRGVPPAEVVDFIREDIPELERSGAVIVRVRAQSDTGLGRYNTFTHLDTRGLLGRPAPARWTV